MKPPTRSRMWSIPPHHRTRTKDHGARVKHHPYGDGSTPSRYKLAQQLIRLCTYGRQKCHVTLIRFIKVQMLTWWLSRFIAILAHWRPLSLCLFVISSSSRVEDCATASATQELCYKSWLKLVPLKIAVRMSEDSAGTRNRTILIVAIWC